MAREKRRKTKPLTFIPFVKPGEKASKTQDAGGILPTATDWQRRELGRRLQILGEIAHTSLRPDIVIWSMASKQVVL